MGNDNVKDYPPYLDYPKHRKPPTNADKIRSMSDEELAELISENIDCAVCQDKNDGCPRCKIDQSCFDFWLDWLRQEAET